MKENDRLVAEMGEGSAGIFDPTALRHVEIAFKHANSFFECHGWSGYSSWPHGWYVGLNPFRTISRADATIRSSDKLHLNAHKYCSNLCNPSWTAS